MKAIRIERTGGPEVLQYADVEDPVPKPGQIVIRVTSIGVNFIDTYHRTGLYQLPLPSGLGGEAVGVVEAIGEGVTRFKIGDRIGTCSAGIGAYAEKLALRANGAIALPASISDDIAAASLLKGMTARYLLRKTFPVEPQHVAVIHAAAGGVGQIAVQWAKHLGATVIAIVGSDAKGDLVRTLGADHIIISTREDIPSRVRELTNGEGADVVYDSVGKDTFEASLKSLKPLGMFVSYGNASGAVPPFSPQLLAQNGSLFFTRPVLNTYVRTPALLQESADDLFGVLQSGAVKVAAPKAYKLAEAAQAHRDLEARKTTGSLVLHP